MSLKDYHKKRDFTKSPEPQGEVASSDGSLGFVIQWHSASHLHFDLRLEINGVYQSWAVPKGVSQNPLDNRLAVHVESHPLDYGRFEGVIPEGNYGAGTVMLWDTGYYWHRQLEDRNRGEKALAEGLEKGQLTVVLNGHRTKGEFALVRTKGKNWILIKKRDAWAVYKEARLEDKSILTSRTMDEIRQQSETSGELWQPGKGPENPEVLKILQNPPPLESTSNLKSRSRPSPSSQNQGGGGHDKEAFPWKLGVMEPVVVFEVFDEENWLFHLMYGGLRCLIYKQNRAVKIFSRKGKELTKNFPAMCGELAKSAGDFILDGEVGYQAPRGRSLNKRDFEGSKEFGYVFDMLHLDGNSLRDLPLHQRLANLSQWWPSLSCLELVEPTPEVGSGIVVEAEGAQSWLGRHSQSGYLPGINELWQMVNLKEERGASLQLSNLQKIYFPESRITKGQIIDYYREVAPLLLPHLEDRPQSLHRFPGGIQEQGFYHKDMVGFLPRFVETMALSGSSGRTINYLLCQNLETLLYMVNLGCIEINPWFSRKDTRDEPDFSVIDLDPDKQTFSEVRRICQEVCSVLEKAALPYFIKTSGATGLHVLVPLEKGASYDQSRRLAHLVCLVTQVAFPELSTVERVVNKRSGRLYLDYMQNRRGQTIASIYSVRPREEAPISCPITAQELDEPFEPRDFRLDNIHEKLKGRESIWQDFFTRRTDVATAIEALEVVCQDRGIDL